MSETVATDCQNKADKQRDEHLCFLAAARDFHSAGPDAFHPGWAQYGDLLDAAENALASSACALASAHAEMARLREALDMAAFRMQMLVDRLPPDEDGKSSKWLSQTYVTEARAALTVQP